MIYFQKGIQIRPSDQGSISSGFTLVELLVSLGLLAGLVLIFAQVISNFYTSTKKIEQTSIFEKNLIASVLEFRAGSFDDIRRIIEASKSQSFKCSNSSRPTKPSAIETILYNWKDIGSGFEQCIDIDSFEFEFNSNLIDIKFHSSVRNKASKELIPRYSKTVVMRRGR